MATPGPHDTVVEQLAADLRELLGPGGPTVLTRARCQLLHEFPESLTTFDVAVLHAEPRWEVRPGGPVLGPGDAPRAGINVVAADTLEEDTIRTPNTLARTAVSEYVLFDPTGDVLRPTFQTSWKGDGELNRSWPGIKGVFFSGAGFRLDVSGGALVVAKTGPRHLEEELFVLRRERDNPGATGRGSTAGLAARIAKLEARLSDPRWSDGDGP